MSKTQQVELAKMIVSHPAFEEMQETIHMKLFKRFRTASPAEREVINAIMDNATLFYTEVQSLVDLTKELGDKEDE